MDSADQPKSSRRRFVKYLGATGAVGLAGCIGDADDEEADEVIIGSNHPLSGDLGDTGTRMDNAVQLAAMMKNEDGGIDSLDGAEVEVISGDNQGEAELGGEVTDELVDDGAHVLTGCFSSPVTSAATVAAEAAQVPFVISVSVADDILQETPMEYTYRPQPRSDQMAQDHAELFPQVVRDAGYEVETAGIFYIDIDFGQSIRDSLQEYLPDEGIDVIETQGVDFGETPDVQVTSFIEADPDMIACATYGAQTVNFAAAMEDQNYRPEFFTGCANEAFNDRSSLQEMGEIVEGGLMTNYALNPLDDQADEVRDRFEDEFDQSFDATVAMSYGAAQVIIEGIEEAGSTDHEEINDAISDITVEDHIMAMPPITFDDRGENENALAPLFQVQDLEDRVIFPEEYAETEVQL